MNNRSKSEVFSYKFFIFKEILKCGATFYIVIELNYIDLTDFAVRNFLVREFAGGLNPFLESIVFLIIEVRYENTIFGSQYRLIDLVSK